MHMRVSLAHRFLMFSGRIDDRNPEKPEFVFPASSLSFRFFGREARLMVTNRNAYWNNAAGAIVDGVHKKFDLENQGVTELVLLREEEDREHDILFYKRMDGCHEMVLEELRLSEGARLLPPREMPRRRIEIYGDSVSAGEVSEALHCIGRPDPEHQGEFSNSWYSYGWILARKLNARLHAIAQGGIALMDGTEWFLEDGQEVPMENGSGTPEQKDGMTEQRDAATEWEYGAGRQMGMETVWDKVHCHPELGEPTYWDFSRYTPQLVIVAVGQNDSHPRDFMAEGAHSPKSMLWKERYGKFLRSLREKYPEAHILCITTLLEHDSSWDDAIEEVCGKSGDGKIGHYRFRRNGRGTPGHLRIPEAEEMAEELAVYLDGLEIGGGW